MYKIIGADQKEYGPIELEQLRQWLTQGRVNGQTLVQAEGATDWRPLSSYPELAALLPPPTAAPPPPMRPLTSTFSNELYNRDYDLDIGQCLANAFELLKKNFGLLFGACAIFLVIQMAISALAQIPFVGILASIGSIIITGPLTGGLYGFCIRVVRGQPAEMGEIFDGFRAGFGQLLLGYLVTAVLTFVAAIPGLILLIVPIVIMVSHHAANALWILVSCLGLLIALVPATYLGISWLFTLPLIVDKGMEFWPAMEASRKMVGKHWWTVFGLAVVCGIVNLLGMAACCVGVFFTIPIVFCAFVFAYERIFTPPAPAP